MANESPADNKNPTLRQRRLVIGANVLAQILVLLALAIMVNWLVSRHYARFDWTKSGYYKLSDKTKQVLEGLKDPVDVIVFLPPNDKREYVEKVLDDVRNLLAEFQFHGGNKLRVEYVDPERDLARARQIAEEYKLDSPDVIIFACGGRHKYVRLDEMVDLENDRYGDGRFAAHQSVQRRRRVPFRHSNRYRGGIAESLFPDRPWRARPRVNRPPGWLFRTFALHQTRQYHRPEMEPSRKARRCPLTPPRSSLPARESRSPWRK